MNMTTVQLKGVAAALAAHSDGEGAESRCISVWTSVETVSIPILFSSYSNDVLILY